MSDDLNNYLKKRMKLAGTKELFQSIGNFPAVSDTPKTAMTTDTSSFLQRRLTLGGVKEASKKLPGTIGKGVALGVLGVEAVSEGLKKLRSMKGRDAEPEIPSDVENKSKGGSIMARGNKLARMRPTKMY